jgi:hypothetical protein
MIVISAALLACGPACATTDLSFRLANETGNPAVSPAVSSLAGARHLGLGALVRFAQADRAWLATVLGFGLLGVLGRRSDSRSDEQL